MEPLDLRVAPPRSGRAELANTAFLPRTIDKLRATLPGGQLGEYNIEGFTTMMLERLAIGVDELKLVVAAAVSDDEVATYVTQHAAPGGAQAWNEFLLNRKIFNGDRAAAIDEIPWLADHPEIQLSVDLLTEDDRRTFAAR